jgi:hypothetical protein
MGFTLPNGTLPPLPPQQPPPLGFTKVFVVFIGNIGGANDVGRILVKGDIYTVSKDAQIGIGLHNQGSSITFNIPVFSTISMYVYTKGQNLEDCMQIENITTKCLTFSYCEIKEP